MANRHDYIILNKKLDRYFEILMDNLGLEVKLNEVERRRIGFYIFILEQVCNESDIAKIANCVIDSSYNRSIFNRGINDCGVDAIFIDDENHDVKLFNFKYRDSFNPDKTQKLNDSFISVKFINMIIADDRSVFKKYPKDVSDKLEKLASILNKPTEEWRVTLYQVSNEANEVKQVNGELDRLAETYAIDIKPIALPSISEYMTIRPENIDAKVIFDNEAIMSYSEDSKASAKSFIARMKCSDILRITCNSPELRNTLNLEDSSVLQVCKLDFGVLFDNVRGLVRKSKFNENIADSLKNNPKKFFMYNNGITIVSENINAKPLPGNKSVKLELGGIQVVNGGQTLRTIHEFNQKDPENLEKYLYDAEVLVRIFMPDNERDEAHKIAEYTNSQNPIKSIDLKSLALEQIEIERYLDEHNIAYARKTGDTGSKDDKKYIHTVSMEILGKLLKARSGQPEKTTSSIKGIFEEDYQRLFVDDFDITTTPQLIKDYFDIIKTYKELQINGNQLKYFYVIYVKQRRPDFNIDSIVKDLESTLDKYVAENNLTQVKALGSSQFKKHLMQKLNIDN